MNDLLRKAVELADGWYITHIYDGEDIVAWGDEPSYPPSFVLQSPTQWGLDALAAQLRRQVNATGKYAVHIEPHMVIVCSIADDGSHKRVTEWVEDDGDESMNSIKAIVESGVLGGSDE